MREIGNMILQDSVLAWTIRIPVLAYALILFVATVCLLEALVLGRELVRFVRDRLRSSSS